VLIIGHNVNHIRRYPRTSMSPFLIVPSDKCPRVS
jgi:hypothetical protein